MIGSWTVVVGLVALVVGWGQIRFIERQGLRLLRRTIASSGFLTLLAGLRLAVAGGVLLTVATVGVWAGVYAMVGYWLGRTLALIAAVRWRV